MKLLPVNKFIAIVPKLLFVILAASGLLLTGCEKWYEQSKYERPSWLPGKVYTTVDTQEDLTKFAECLRLTGLDTIIDISGCFTVFAPSDSAINLFLAENNFSSVKDIPKDQLERIVKFHIIQDPWSLNQLQLLDVSGWIDPDNPNQKPWAYKRQTILKNPNRKYWLKDERDADFIAMDSTNAKGYRRVYTRSRKFVPIFYDKFLDISNLSPEDYGFYFDREYEPGNIYYGGAKVISSEIFAENGYVYVIDRVVNPMLNANELLERELPGESYKIFLEMVYLFAKFETNKEETNNQSKRNYGSSYDKLYNLSFPNLPFDLNEELISVTGSPRNYAHTEWTYAYHNGIYAPTDEAFESFVNDILTAKSGFPHWPTLESVPPDLRRIIVRPHFTDFPVYKKDIQNGFINGVGNEVILEEEDLQRKEFGSNCTFLGIKKLKTPRVFSSITGPVYLRPAFSTFRLALQYSGTDERLAKAGENYIFFPVPDRVLQEDSSLLKELVDVQKNTYRFTAYNRRDFVSESMSPGLLRKRILDQVGVSVPHDSANKVFIKTLGNNYIIWNWEENTVSGTKPNTVGYNGIKPIHYQPVKLEEPVDNGEVWSVDSWFSNVTDGMFVTMFKRYRYFMTLLQRAGLYSPQLYSFPFLDDKQSYTIFIPSYQALESYNAYSMRGEELESFLRYHFVRGMIFTDNSKEWKNYSTLREDESSSPFNTYYSKLNIRPGPDLIEVLDTSGVVRVSIPEAPEKTNIMVATDGKINRVIHEIDAVIIKE